MSWRNCSACCWYSSFFEMFIMYLVCAGNDTCIPCEIGKYNELTGRAECPLCLPGTVASSAGSSACTPCRNGTAQPAPGTAHSHSLNVYHLYLFQEMILVSIVLKASMLATLVVPYVQPVALSSSLLLLMAWINAIDVPRTPRPAQTIPQGSQALTLTRTKRSPQRSTYEYERR